MPESKTSVPGIIDSRAKLAAVHNTALACTSGPEGKPATRLSRYVSTVRQHCWKILFFVATCSLITLLLSKRLTPVYESTATLDADRQMLQGIGGQDTARRPLDDIDQFFATQIKMIQSDSVLRPVALKYNLLAREQQDTDLPNGSPLQRKEAPIVLKKLRVSRPAKTYLLEISYRSTDSRVAADVANAIAASYIEHTYDICTRSSAGLSSYLDKQVETLKARMDESSLILAKFARESNMTKPEDKMSAQSARLEELETKYAKAQADRLANEAEYNSVKTPSLEAVAVAPSQQPRALQLVRERLGEANEQLSNAKAKFGVNRPEYKRAAATVSRLTNEFDRTRKKIATRAQAEYIQALGREHTLAKQLEAAKANLDTLNARFFQYKSLQRRAEADKRVYEGLLQKISAIGMNSGSQSNTMRLADLARPGLTPVLPNIPLNVSVACLLATILAIVAVMLSEHIDHTVHNPDQAHKIFNADVIGLPAVPRSRTKWRASADNKSCALMRWQDGSDKRVAGYVEAIRRLRNSITLSNMDRRLKSILIASAGPMEGKSTTAVHFALAHAEQRHKTLLVDCNLRRSSIHRYFDVSNSVGLTNVINEGVPWRDAVTRVDETPELHLLLSGPLTRTAPDLIGQEIASIITEAEKEYELIVVDAPPMLGVTEALQIATFVGGVVIVTLAGQTDRRAVASLLDTLNGLRIRVPAIVLNRLSGRASDDYNYGYCNHEAQVRRA